MRTFKYEFEKQTMFGIINEDYYYTVEEDELIDALVEIFYRMCFDDNNVEGSVEFAENVCRGIRKMITEIEGFYSICDEYEESLKDYFEDEARYKYNREQKYR